MNRRISIITFACLSAIALHVHAQPNTTPKNIAKPQLFPGGKPGDIGSIKKGEPTGARYRLHMSFSPRTRPDDDGTNDGGFEGYGTLKINGETWWEMPRSGSRKGAQQFIETFVPNNVSTSEKAMQYGYSLTKSSAFNHDRKFEFDAYKDDPRTSSLHIELKLYDADTPPGSSSDKDDLFGNYDFKANLSKGASYYYFWKDGVGNGSDLYIYVEQVKELYDKPNNGPSKIDTKPVIIKPDIIKGPGPVIRKAPLKK